VLGEEEVADQLLVEQAVEKAGAGAHRDLHLAEAAQGLLDLALERADAHVDQQVGVGQGHLAAAGGGVSSSCIERL
jgi:predicted NodU family carbamoyl transferase